MTLQFLSQKEQIAFFLEDMYSKFGFHKYKVNRFEEYSFYMEKVNFLSDSRVITFSDPHGKLLALKPDVTMSIVKNCLKSQEETQKIYYNESVFRIPKGEDEFKEIHQIGVECLGNISEYQSLELLNLAAKSLEKISPEYRLCLSNTALILCLFEDLALNTPQKSQIIEYMTQKNAHDLEKYLQTEKIADKGRFAQILALPTSVSQGLNTLKEIFSGEIYKAHLAQFQTTLENLSKFVPENQLYLDFSHIPSTEYYQGLVFSGYIHGLALPVLVGGRYDNLLKKMEAASTSALGFAVDLSAVDKLFSAQGKEILKISEKDYPSATELLEKANNLYQEGQTFQIST